MLELAASGVEARDRDATESQATSSVEVSLTELSDDDDANDWDWADDRPTPVIRCAPPPALGAQETTQRVRLAARRRRVPGPPRWKTRHVFRGAPFRAVRFSPIRNGARLAEVRTVEVDIRFLRCSDA